MINFFNKNNLTFRNYKLTLIISISAAVVIATLMWFIYINDYNQVEMKYETELVTAIDITNVFVNQHIESMTSKLNMITNSEEIRRFVNDDKNEHFKKSVEEVFSVYGKRDEAITQLRILNNQGLEMVRVNNSNNEQIVIASENLQNKSDRYYFKEAIEIEAEEVYISDYDLNIEAGEIVVPYEPTIRFAQALYDKKGDKYGVLIINVDGYKFFDIIKEYKLSNSENIDIGLLDADNYWSLSKVDSNDLHEIELTITDRKLSQINRLLRENSIDSTVDEVKISDGEMTYIYKKLSFGKERGYIVKSNDYSWYVVGKLNLRGIINQHEFYLENFIVLICCFSILGGSIVYFISILLFVRANNNTLLRLSSQIADNSHDGIIILDGSKKIVHFNYVFQDIFLFERSEIMYKSIHDVFGWNILFDDEASDSNLLWSGSVWNKTKYGNLMCRHLDIKIVRNMHNEIVYYIGVYSNPKLADEKHDVYLEERMEVLLLSKEEIDVIAKYIEEELYQKKESYVIMTLKLTGNIRRIFENSQRTYKQFIMLNKIHTIHKSYNVVAIPRTDIMIMTIKTDDLDGGFDKTIYNEISNYIRKIFWEMQVMYNLHNLNIQYNMGVAVFGPHGSNADSVLRSSMLAAEAITTSKNINIVIYDKNLDQSINESIEIKKYLLDAFDKDEFYMMYQPQYDFDTNGITGFEALIRWQSGELGLVSPDKFVRVLEEMGEIPRLGIVVMDKVIRDMNKIYRYISGKRLSINLSPEEFSNEKIIEKALKVKEQLDRFGVELCLEITETTLIENFEKVKTQIKRVREYGIAVSIDDFGTGYSSLSYLNMLDTDELKIDRIFISSYPEDDDGKVFNTIIDMGQKLNMSVLAEGIETKEQYDFAKSLGCDKYQGYYGSKPLIIGDLKLLIRNKVDEGY